MEKRKEHMGKRKHFRNWLNLAIELILATIIAAVLVAGLVLAMGW